MMGVTTFGMFKIKKCPYSYKVRNQKAFYKKNRLLESSSNL